ncbi:MAG: sulfatase-like hydrolase/transferase, partial [Verrucomicrobiales bacterium]|nr:sulfatase-like hydrolase/transferase [Verrucomicrobiales bacterium]
TSDNGPWLSYGDHAGSSGIYREGKGTCWEGGTRVSCIMRWPGHIPADTTSNAMLMTIDVLPTFAHLIGANLPDHAIDGRDAWSIISGPPDAAPVHDFYAFYYANNQLQAITSGDGRWKLILPHQYRTLAGGPGGKDGIPVKYQQASITDPELYDLYADPSESKNLAASEPAELAKMEAYAETMRRELGDSLQKRQGTGVREPGHHTPH